MDVKSQRIVTQLQHLYACYPSDTMVRTFSHILYNHVFDFLSTQNINLVYPAEIKESLRKMANLELNAQRKGWIKLYKLAVDPEIKKFIHKMLKDEFVKFYKTYLVRKYLYDLMDNEGKKLVLSADGKEIKVLELTV